MCGISIFTPYKTIFLLHQVIRTGFISAPACYNIAWFWIYLYIRLFIYCMSLCICTYVPYINHFIHGLCTFYPCTLVIFKQIHYCSVLSRKLFNETDESTVFNNYCAFWFVLHWINRFTFRDYEFWIVTLFINTTNIYINALNFVKEA